MSILQSVLKDTNTGIEGLKYIKPARAFKRHEHSYMLGHHPEYLMLGKAEEKSEVDSFCYPAAQ